MGIYISNDWALLSTVSAIGALAPDQIELVHDEELGDYVVPLTVKKPGASAKLFRYLVKKFKEITALNPPVTPELQMRAFTALRSWAASETEGIARELLKGLVPSINEDENSVRSLLETAHTSTKKCHEILNALHADRRLALGNLFFFGSLHCLMLLNMALNTNRFLFKEQTVVSFRIESLDKVNCYFFALILRHHELFDPEYGNIFYPRNLKAFLSEAKELDAKGLFGDYERSLISSMKTFLLREYTTELQLTSQSSLAEGIILSSDVRDCYSETWENESCAHKVLDYVNTILATQKSVQEGDEHFSLNEVENILKYNFEIIEQLPAQLERYHAA